MVQFLGLYVVARSGFINAVSGEIRAKKLHLWHFHISRYFYSLYVMRWNFPLFTLTEELLNPWLSSLAKETSPKVPIIMISTMEGELMKTMLYLRPFVYLYTHCEMSRTNEQQILNMSHRPLLSLSNDSSERKHFLNRFLKLTQPNL